MASPRSLEADLERVAGDAHVHDSHGGGVGNPRERNRVARRAVDALQYTAVADVPYELSAVDRVVTTHSGAVTPVVFRQRTQEEIEAYEEWQANKRWPRDLSASETAVFCACTVLVSLAVSMAVYSTINDLQGHRGYDVLVVGGGVSGVAAADALVRANQRVALLEAKQIWGGRVHVHETALDRSGKNTSLPLGAVFFSNYTDNPLLAPLGGQETLHQHCLPLSRVSLSLRSGTAVSESRVNALRKTLAAAWDDALALWKQSERTSTMLPSTGQFDSVYVMLHHVLAREVSAEDKDIIDWLIWHDTDLLKGYPARDTDPSTYFGVRDRVSLDAPRCLLVSPMLSYQALVQHSVRYLQTESERRSMRAPQLWTNMTVAHVEWSEDAVTVTTQYDRFVGDRAILAFPLDALLDARVTFSPPLPAWKRAAVAKMRKVDAVAVYLAYDTPWWRNTTAGSRSDASSAAVFGVVGSTWGEHAAFIDLHRGQGSSSRPPMLYAVFFGDAAKQLEMMSTPSATRYLTTLLQAAVPAARDVPTPRRVVRSSWTQDPHFGSAYPSAMPAMRADLLHRLSAPIGGLHFAGDWATEHFGTVHGAYQSGRREASRILAEFAADRLSHDDKSLVDHLGQDPFVAADADAVNHDMHPSADVW